MGNENLPSVRSSANPLFDEYWFYGDGSGVFYVDLTQKKIRAHFVAFKVHVVISNLEVDPDQVNERNKVTMENTYKLVTAVKNAELPPYTSMLVVAQAIISLTATRNSPPVSMREVNKWQVNSRNVIYSTYCC